MTGMTGMTGRAMAAGLLVCSGMAPAADAPKPAPAPSVGVITLGPAPAPPAEQPAATPAAGEDGDAEVSLALSPEESVALAKAHRITRLEREIASLEHDLGMLPTSLVPQARRAGTALTAAEYERWLLEAEQQDLRDRIEHLKLRITLLERIEQHQELVDRSRLVVLQNAERDLDTDHAESSAIERRQREDLDNLRILIALRTALHQRLAEVRTEVERLVGLPAAAAPPAEPAMGPAR